MKTEQAVSAVLMRNFFYQRLCYLACALLVLVLITIGLLIGLLVYLIEEEPAPVYFATNVAGQLMRIPPVTEPFPANTVANWTVQAIQAAYAYDYVNYRQQLQSAQQYFTDYGWHGYMQALTASNNLVALTQRKQIVLAQVIGQPRFLKAGILAGAYAWQLQMPLLVTYWEPPYDDKSKFSNALTISVIVQRQPMLQSNAGLGIVQLLSSIATSNAPVMQQLNVNTSS